MVPSKNDQSAYQHIRNVSQVCKHKKTNKVWPYLILICWYSHLGDYIMMVIYNDTIKIVFQN